MRTSSLVALVLIGWGWVGSALGQLGIEASSHTAAVADLNQDGHPDAIDVFFFRTQQGYGADHFLIAVNEVTFAGKGCGLIQRFAVVDIDSTDECREIAIPEVGPSEDYATHFFRYVDHKIVSLGTLPERLVGPPDVDGSGVVHTRCRGHVLETWWHPCEFRVARDQSGFEAIKERYWHIGTSVVLKLDLPLTSAPWGHGTTAVLHAGDKVTLLRTDDEHWCELESSDGVRGWFAVLGWGYIPVVSARATDLFDGLMIAD